jgi:hypothetical protein
LTFQAVVAITTDGHRHDQIRRATISSAWSTGRGHLGALRHAEPVARVVAEGRLDAVEALGRLGQEADPSRLEFFIRRLTVVGLEG